jgi:hypothetical protein
MDISDFIQKVSEMRNEQKSYFKYRTPDHLQAAKKLEREVDSEIQRLTGTSPGKTKETEQPRLF